MSGGAYQAYRQEEFENGRLPLGVGAWRKRTRLGQDTQRRIGKGGGDERVTEPVSRITTRTGMAMDYQRLLREDPRGHL